MKAQNTYTITPKEESQINNILDEGLDELIGQDGIIKHSEPHFQTASPPHIYNRYMHNRNETNNGDELVNKHNNTQRYYWNECSSNSCYGNNTNNNIGNNGYNHVGIVSGRYYSNKDSLSQMKNEMKYLQEGINKLEQKLFQSTSNENTLMPSSASFNNTLYSTTACVKNPSMTSQLNNCCSSNIGNDNTTTNTNMNVRPSEDYKKRLVDKENEILNLKNQVEDLLKEKESLQLKVNQQSESLSLLQNKNKVITEEKSILQTYKNDYEKLKGDYKKLLNEYRISEQLRNEQKQLIQHMQHDIDTMRQQSFNKIKEIELEQKIKEENKKYQSGTPEIKSKSKSVAKKKKIKKKNKI